MRENGGRLDLFGRGGAESEHGRLRGFLAAEPLPGSDLRITVQGMITVEKLDTTLLVKIPQGAVPPDRLETFLSWLRQEEGAKTGAPDPDTGQPLLETVPAPSIEKPAAPFWQRASPAERAADILHWARRHRQEPSLPASAVGRDGIYD